MSVSLSFGAMLAGVIGSADGEGEGEDADLIRDVYGCQDPSRCDKISVRKALAAAGQRPVPLYEFKCEPSRRCWC